MIKYLEIDSTYRNRQKWPMQALFNVDNSRQTPNDDPVSDAQPIVAWNGAYNVDVNGTVQFSSPDSMIISGTFQTDVDYYANTIVNPPGSRITSSRHLGMNKMLITIDPRATNLPTFGSSTAISQATDLTVGLLFVPRTSRLSRNAFIDKILYDETLDRYSKIIGYDESTGCITVSPPIPGWNASNRFSVRDKPPIMANLTAGVTLANNIVVGVPPNVFKGDFVRLIPSYPNVSPAGETRQIVDYDPDTNTATIYPPFSGNASGLKYEILENTRPNYFPLMYSGTVQQDLINCTVRLLNLMLPNRVLSVGYGGTPFDYPYLYVKLTPGNARNININCSNNPHSSTTLFRAVPSYCHSKNFVKFTGDDASVRLRFIIDSDFMFEVTLPNGETLQYEEADTTSPSRPNPLLQISCSFEIIATC